MLLGIRDVHAGEAAMDTGQASAASGTVAATEDLVNRHGIVIGGGV
ncbi:hypothetical protein [Streptomyces sp. NPDC094468]